MEPYRLLILPNFAMMSDLQAQALTGFAERGGSLLATYQTGLFTETGVARADFALGALFGVSKTARCEARAETVLGSLRPSHLQSIRKVVSSDRGFRQHGLDRRAVLGGPRFKPRAVRCHSRSLIHTPSTRPKRCISACRQVTVLL